MATLTLIGESLPGANPLMTKSMLTELALAFATTAPKGCDVTSLLGRSSEAPATEHPKLRYQHYPVPAAALPLLWQRGATSRGVTGELQHAATPLAALRSDDEAPQQTSVTVPNALAWSAPEALPPGVARLTRAFTRRAVRHADLIVTPTHACAEVLREVYGDHIELRVIPFAPLDACRRPEDHDEIAARLALPEEYLVTTGAASESGRLRWLLEAMAAGAAGELPLVVLGLGGSQQDAEGAPPEAAEPERPAAEPGEPSGATAVATKVRPAKQRRRPGRAGRAADSLDALLAEFPTVAPRVTVVAAASAAEIGAVIAGARLFVHPQRVLGTGLSLLTALSDGVPVLHAGDAGTAELVLDGGEAFADAAELAERLRHLTGDESARTRLSLLAEDRGRSFGWSSTAWHLWQMHADL